jgi:hypothetical protein
VTIAVGRAAPLASATAPVTLPLLACEKTEVEKQKRQAKSKPSFNLENLEIINSFSNKCSVREVRNSTRITGPVRSTTGAIQRPPAMSLKGIGTDRRVILFPEVFLT